MIDIINTLSLKSCRNTKHRIYFEEDGIIKFYTLAEVDKKAIHIAHQLFLNGIRPRDRVGIMAHNRIEWILLDLAIIKLGAVTAGFEPGRYDATEIINKYNLKILFTDSNIDLIRQWSEKNVMPSTAFPFHAGYDPADICAIKFTSGSTGIPKGLEATASSINSSLSTVQEMFKHSDGDNILIFLRLALLQQRYWIYSAFINAHDITLSTIDDVLTMAKKTSPTVIMGVPGFYEEVKSCIKTDNLADRRKAIQSMLGGHIRYLWTGSAPASHSVLEFFNNCQVPLYEGYGLNETCIVAKNYPGTFRLGSVGKILPNKTARFDKEGILIINSHHPVNCKYTWCSPGTNEKIFLPTGEVKTYDLAHLDEEGFLYIHGRIDDILTLSNGRNVLTKLIEEKLREHPDIHECVLYGNGRSFLTAVISPNSANINQDAIKKYIQKLNITLLPEQRIYNFIIAEEKFSIENDLLTSQFKPKRQNIYNRFNLELENLYELERPK